MVHRIGLSYKFGASTPARGRAEAFSPTGERAVTRSSLNSAHQGRPRPLDARHPRQVQHGGAPLRGKGQPPAHVEWDGKDETGLPMADGRYRYLLAVQDAQDASVLLEALGRDLDQRPAGLGAGGAGQ